MQEIGTPGDEHTLHAAAQVFNIKINVYMLNQPIQYYGTEDSRTVHIAFIRSENHYESVRKIEGDIQFKIQKFQEENPNSILPVITKEAQDNLDDLFDYLLITGNIWRKDQKIPNLMDKIIADPVVSMSFIELHKMTKEVTKKIQPLMDWFRENEQRKQKQAFKTLDKLVKNCHTLRESLSSAKYQILLFGPPGSGKSLVMNLMTSGFSDRPFHSSQDGLSVTSYFHKVEYAENYSITVHFNSNDLNIDCHSIDDLKVKLMPNNLRDIQGEIEYITVAGPFEKLDNSVVLIDSKGYEKDFQQNYNLEVLKKLEYIDAIFLFEHRLAGSNVASPILKWIHNAYQSVPALFSTIRIDDAPKQFKLVPDDEVRKTIRERQSQMEKKVADIVKDISVDGQFDAHNLWKMMNTIHKTCLYIDKRAIAKDSMLPAVFDDIKRACQFGKCIELGESINMILAWSEILLKGNTSYLTDECEKQPEGTRPFNFKKKTINKRLQIASRRFGEKIPFGEYILQESSRLVNMISAGIMTHDDLLKQMNHALLRCLDNTASTFKEYTKNYSSFAVTSVFFEACKNDRRTDEMTSEDLSRRAAFGSCLNYIRSAMHVQEQKLFRDLQDGDPIITDTTFEKLRTQLSSMNLLSGSPPKLELAERISIEVEPIIKNFLKEALDSRIKRIDRAVEEMKDFVKENIIAFNESAGSVNLKNKGNLLKDITETRKEWKKTIQDLHSSIGDKDNKQLAIESSKGSFFHSGRKDDIIELLNSKRAEQGLLSQPKNSSKSLRTVEWKNTSKLAGSSSTVPVQQNIKMKSEVKTLSLELFENSLLVHDNNSVRDLIEKYSKALDSCNTFITLKDDQPNIAAPMFLLPFLQRENDKYQEVSCMIRQEHEENPAEYHIMFYLVDQSKEKEFASFLKSQVDDKSRLEIRYHIVVSLPSDNLSLAFRIDTCTALARLFKFPFFGMPNPFISTCNLYRMQWLSTRICTTGSMLIHMQNTYQDMLKSAMKMVTSFMERETKNILESLGKRNNILRDRQNALLRHVAPSHESQEMQDFIQVTKKLQKESQRFEKLSAFLNDTKTPEMVLNSISKMEEYLKMFSEFPDTYKKALEAKCLSSLRSVAAFGIGENVSQLRSSYMNFPYDVEVRTHQRMSLTDMRKFSFFVVNNLGNACLLTDDEYFSGKKDDHSSIENSWEWEIQRRVVMETLLQKLSGEDRVALVFSLYGMTSRNPNKRKSRSGSKKRATSEGNTESPKRPRTK